MDINLQKALVQSALKGGKRHNNGRGLSVSPCYHFTQKLAFYLRTRTNDNLQGMCKYLSTPSIFLAATIPLRLHNTGP